MTARDWDAFFAGVFTTIIVIAGVILAMAETKGGAI